MKKKTEFSVPAVGAGSLLCAFAVLCLTVFALLSLTTVRGEGRLAEASAQAVRDYYAADLQAEEIFAALRRGELPEEVIRQDNVYSYRCPISENQYLLVALEKTEAGWQVLCWQAVAREMTGETDTLPVWQGVEAREETP